MNRFAMLAACMAFACCVNTTSVTAQDEPVRSPTFQPKDGDKNSAVGIISPQQNDSRIARWLIIDQQAIVDCSKMAQERSTNDNVKQFAQMMVTEHNTCVDKLEAIRKATDTATGSETRNNPVIGRTDNAVVDPKRAGVLVKDPEGKQRDGKLMYHPTDFVQVKEEVCKHMKATMAKEMKAITGSDFDRAYMMHIVAGHEAMLATCKAVRPTASKEFQAMLDQNIDKLTTHTKLARQLCDQVCGKTSTGSLDNKDKSKIVR